MKLTEKNQLILRTVSEISLTLNETPFKHDILVNSIDWGLAYLNLDSMTLSVEVNGGESLSTIQFRALEGIAMKYGLRHELHQAPLTEEEEYLWNSHLQQISMLEELQKGVDTT